MFAVRSRRFTLTPRLVQLGAGVDVFRRGWLVLKTGVISLLAAQPTPARLQTPHAENWSQESCGNEGGWQALNYRSRWLQYALTPGNLQSRIFPRENCLRLLSHWK